MDPVVHFEMPCDDRARVARFYESVFGWGTQALGEEMGNYLLVQTADSDEQGPRQRGAINGGFYPRKADWPDQYPSVVIAVDSIDEAMGKVKSQGGEVLGEPMEIPGIGQYVSFKDTEGNRVGMLQPLPRSGHGQQA